MEEDLEEDGDEEHVEDLEEGEENESEGVYNLEVEGEEQEDVEEEGAGEGPGGVENEDEDDRETNGGENTMNDVERTGNVTKMSQTAIDAEVMTTGVV